MSSKIRTESGTEWKTPIASPAPGNEENIRINGLEQIIEMLRHADPAFRGSLLRRLQARDPSLARKLAQILR